MCSLVVAHCALSGGLLAQITLMSGYNFGQFLGEGAPSLNGQTFDTVGFVGANWETNVPPPATSSGDFVGNNELTGGFENNTGRVYWDGTSGSSTYALDGTQITSVIVGPNAVNGATVVPGQTIAFLGDNQNLGLQTSLPNGILAFVQDTRGYVDYVPAGANPANLTFAASVTTPVTVTFTSGSFSQQVNLSGGFGTIYSVDLPSDFFGQESATLLATFSGIAILDNVQFNGSLGDVPAPSGDTLFWKGGAGTWSATGSDWRPETGDTPTAWNSKQARFRAVTGAVPGAVVVDNAGVTFTGIKFDVTGYTISGGTLTTTTPATVIDVGEGASASSTTATVSSVIAGTGGIDKRGAGTLTLSGDNTYTGVTAVSAGTLLVNGDSSATSNVTVASGAKLGGTGEVSAVTIGAGGALIDPASLEGTFTMASLTMTSTSLIEVTLGAPGNTASLFDVTGNLTLAGTLTITQGTGFAAGTYSLFDFGGTLAGLSSVQFNTVTGFSFALQENTSQVNLVVTASGPGPDPEPTPDTLFWKGGAGTWTAAATPAEWRTTAGGTTPAAWNSKDAVFGAVTGATPGVVAVEAAGVTATSIKFETSGYEVGGTGEVTLTAAATPIQVGQGQSAAETTAEISAVLTGANGGIDKTGAGTLILSGDNDYKGATSISAGTLVIDGNQTDATGAITVKSGATLTGGGTVGGKVTVQAGGRLLAPEELDGVFTLSGGLELTPTSLIEISLGTPTTTGFFNVAGAFKLDGDLRINQATGFGAGVYTLFDYTGTLDNQALNLLAITGFNGQIAATGGKVTLTLTSDTPEPTPDPEPVAPAFTQWKGGAGDWTAATNNTNWRNADGTQSGAWQGGSATFAGTAGTVNVQTTAGPVTFSDLKFDTTGYTVAGSNLTTSTTGEAKASIETGASVTTTVSSTITGANGLEKKGTGTLILTADNTYTGGTTVTAGTLQIGNGGASGGVEGDIVNNGSLVFNRSGITPYGGVISGTGSATISAGTLIVTGNHTYTGGTTIAASATLQLGNGGTSGSGTGDLVNNGTLRVNRSNEATLAGVISGTGALVQAGTGTTILTGANTYTGTTTVSSGTLRIDGNQTAATGAITVQSGATLAGEGSTGGVVTVEANGRLAGQAGEKLTVAGLTLNDASRLDFVVGTPSASPLVQVNGNLALDGVLNLGRTNGGTLAVGSYRLIDYSGTLSPASPSVTLGNLAVNPGDLTVSASASNPFSATVTATTSNYWSAGAGTWTAAGSDTSWKKLDNTGGAAWAGQTATFVGTAGEVTVSNAGGAVNFTGLQFLVDGYQLKEGTLTTTTAATRIQVGNATASGSGIDASISSVIAGSGGIEKTDRGTLVLGGANTYAGETVISEGTLIIDGNQSGAGAVTVRSGATLAGQGTTAGAVTVQNGGVLRGESGRTLTMGALSLNNLSRVLVQLGAPTTTELFKVNGNLTLDGVLDIQRKETDAGVEGYGAGLYRIFNYTGTLTNNTMTIGTTPTSGFTNTLQTSVANQVNLLVDVGELPVWAGGSGIWSASNTSTNWNAANGGSSGAWEAGLAIFQGTPGTVTVQSSSAAPVEITGLQFASTGYVIQGGALTTTTPNTLLRAGDGTSSGASVSGTILAPIVGTGGVEKTDLGTIVLAGENTYTGGTTVSSGTLQIGAGSTTGSILGNVTNNSVLAFNRSDTFTFTGAISGSGTVNQIGTGTLVLAGANSYTGDTTISSGVLQVGNGGTSGSLTGDVINNAALAFNRSDRLVYSGVVSGTGELRQTGSGTTVLTGTNTFTGTTQITAGTLQVGDGGQSGSLTGNVVNNATLVFNRSNSTAFTGNVSGSGLLVQQGTGILTLTGNATHTGGTEIRSGTLRVGLGGTAGSLSGNVVNNGILEVNKTNATTLSGDLSGTGSLNQNGTGTTILTGTNTFTGGTTVTRGTLQIGAGGNRGSLTGDVTVSSGATLAVNRSDTVVLDSTITGAGAFRQSGSGTTVITGANTYTGVTTIAAGTLQLGNGGTSGSVTGNIFTSNGTTSGTLAVNRSDTVVLTNVISGAGAFRQSGSGTTVLTGANTYTGATTVSAGTLQIGNGGTTGAIASTSAVTNNGTLAINRSDAVTFANNVSGSGAFVHQGSGVVTVTGNLTHTGGTTISSGTLKIGSGGTTGSLSGNIVNNGGLTVDRSDAVTLNGAISGSGKLDKLGAGTLTLTGANTYSGGTTVAAGTLQIGNGGASGSIAGDIVNNGTVAINRADTVNLASGITGSGSLRQAGTGTTVITGTAAHTGGTTIASGTLQIGNGGTAGSVTGAVTNNGTLAINRSDEVTLAGVISGTGALRQIGAGTTRLSGANTYTGGTEVAVGTLQIGTGGTTGSLTGNITNNGTVAFDRSDAVTFAGAITGSGAVVQKGSGTTVLTGTHTYSGGTTISAGTLAIGAGAATGSVTGNIVNNGTLSINRTGTVTVSNNITGTGGVELRGGTYALTGTNTYAGGTTLTSKATLDLSDDSKIGVSTGGITLRDGTLRAGANLTTNRTIVVGDGGGIIDTGANNLTLAGSLGGQTTATLTKRGSGTLTVTGTAANTGPATTVEEGALALNGGSVHAVTVAAGARVIGNGTIRGDLTNAGTLSPGNSVGTVNVTGNLNQTGSFAVELASATSFDKVAVTGNATLAGALNITALNGYVPEPGQSFQVVTAGGTVSGSFATVTSPYTNMGPMLQFTSAIDTGNKAFTLTMKQLPFAGVKGISDNQKIVGSGIDKAIAKGNIKGLQKALNALPTEAAVLDALDELSPIAYDRWFSQSVYSANATLRSIENRMAQVTPDPQGALWTEVVRRESTFDATTEIAESESTTNGILVGGDIRGTTDFQAGVVFGYTDESLDLDQKGGTTDAKRFSGSVYTRYDFTPLFVEAAAGIAMAELESRRTIVIPGYTRTAESKTDSQDVYGSLRVGYNLAAGIVRLTPYAGAQYVRWSVDEFQETGADDANLSLSAQSRNSLSSRAGLMLAFPIMGENVSFIPKVDVAWRHEFEDEERLLGGQIGGGTFVFDSSKPTSGGTTGSAGGVNPPVPNPNERKKNGIIAGLGLDVIFGSSLTTYLRVSTESNTASDRAIEARAGTELRF